MTTPAEYIIIEARSNSETNDWRVSNVMGIPPNRDEAQRLVNQTNGWYGWQKFRIGPA